MITSRSFALSWLIMLLITSACVHLKNKDVAEDVLPGNHHQPSWISDTPLVFIGNWDAMPIFRNRIGGNPVWQEEGYQKEHTEDAVLKYKESGVTMMMLHFYKGFGLKAEKEHIGEARKLADICKRNGLRVGVYVGSTIDYETFLIEEPDAAEWFVPDYLGQPVIYGDQTFRKRVYFMHPGYIKYMKKVLRVAIKDLKADLIHFDNTSMQAEPAIFFHPLAIADFRNYLQNKYSPRLLRKRFGFGNTRYVEPPVITGALSVINDPLVQDWTDFRCHQLSEYYRIMEEYIHSLNPEVAIDNNPHSGLSGINTAWKQGIDYPDLLSHTDFIWTEEGNDPTVTDEGVLISRIRTFKMARTLNNRIFTYTTDSKLEMAEAMAYNRQVMGMVGGLKEMEGNQRAEGFVLPADQQEYIKFYHRNFEFYRNIKAVADVAVLHSYSSLAFNNDRPYQSTWLYEQVLIQNRIPFDIIFDNNLNELKKYKVLILADQESLSGSQLDLIRSFVKNGGGLVVTEFTSLYNEHRDRLRDFGLADLIKVAPPVWKGRNGQETIPDIPVKHMTVDSGRVVYIPEIRPSDPKPSGADMSARYWKLPLNAKDLAEAVLWAARGDMTIKTDAPPEVTMELTMTAGSDKMIIHFINFDCVRNPELKDLPVSLRLPDGKRVAGLQLISPDFTDTIIPESKISDGRLLFTIPILKVYDLLVVRLN